MLTDFYKLDFESRVQLLEQDISIMQDIEFDKKFFLELLDLPNGKSYLSQMLKVPEWFKLEIVGLYPIQCLDTWLVHDEELVLKALKADPRSFAYTYIKTDEVCNLAVSLLPENIKYIDYPSLSLCELALSKDSSCVQYMMELDDPEIIELEFRTGADFDMNYSEETILDLLESEQVSYNRLPPRYKTYEVMVFFGPEDDDSILNSILI